MRTGYDNDNIFLFSKISFLLHIGAYFSCTFYPNFSSSSRRYLMGIIQKKNVFKDTIIFL